MKDKCPVCGFAHAPVDHTICPCCGTEFGYDDATTPHFQLTLRWVKKGAPWFSSALPQPTHWSAARQLLKAGLLPFSTNAAASGNEEVTFRVDEEEQEQYERA